MSALATSGAGRRIPTRTCVGCREAKPEPELVRFAVVPEAPWVVPDPRKRLGGRGVWVGARRECVKKAVERGGFSRALRQKVTLDAAELCERLATLLRQRMEGLILAARRGRHVAMGTDAVRAALQGREVALLVVAADAAGRRDELVASAERLGTRCVVFGDKARLGALFGRSELGVISIQDAGIAEALSHTAARVKALEEAE